MITVSIVEDHAGTRRSLENLLSEASGFRLLHACASGEEALRDIAAAPPQVLLVDINVGSSRVDLQACKLEYSIVSPK